MTQQNAARPTAGRPAAARRGWRSRTRSSCRRSSKTGSSYGKDVVGRVSERAKSNAHLIENKSYGRDELLERSRLVLGPGVEGRRRRRSVPPRQVAGHVT